MLERPGIARRIRDALRRAPIVVLTGPRQCGKTTLARTHVPPDAANYFDLEDPAGLARLGEPMSALRPLRGLVVIDEVQRRPDLFPTLRVLADRRATPSRFLILGSASGDLMRQSSESLAGRVERVEMGGFSPVEVGAARLDSLWRRGGFPRSFLARSERDSAAWRKQFVQTLVERDLPQWGVRVPDTTLRRFWAMVAHYHGQIWNAAELARALGAGEGACRRYLDLFTDALVVRQLQPWHANLKKRQVKSPKVYVRDSGVLHSLLGVGTELELLSHPKVGASWEGFVVEQVLATVPHDEHFFWATHQGAEMDVVLRRGRTLLGFECKRVDAPRMTPSIAAALSDLKLTRVGVIYPGTRRYALAPRVEAIPVGALADVGKRGARDLF